MQASVVVFIVCVFVSSDDKIQWDDSLHEDEESKKKAKEERFRLENQIIELREKNYELLDEGKHKGSTFVLNRVIDLLVYDKTCLVYLIMVGASFGWTVMGYMLLSGQSCVRAR